MSGGGKDKSSARPDQADIGAFSELSESGKFDRAAAATPDSAYRLILERAPMPIAVAHHGSYVFVNTAFARCFGYESAQEALGLSIASNIAPESRAALAARNLSRERGANEPNNYEFEALRKDGTRFPAQVQVDAIQLSGGTITVAFFTDLSAVRAAERDRGAQVHYLESLNRVTELLEQELDVERVLGAVLNEMLSILECERALLIQPSSVEEAGFSVAFRAACAGWHAPLSTTAPENDPAPEFLRAVFSGAEPIELAGERVPARLRAEHERPVQQVSLALRPRAGKPWALVLQRSTERRVWSFDDLRLFKAIAARVTDAISNMVLLGDVRASEERFRQVAEAIPQGVWTAGADGFPDYANARWIRYLGFVPEQFRDIGAKVAFHPEDYERTLRLWRHAVETGELFEIEHRIKSAVDGKYRWYLSRAFPLRDSQGAVIKWFGTATDITERKAAEEDLNAALRKLEAILAAIEDGVAVHNLQGVIYFANDQAARNMGLSSARELMSLPPEKLSHLVVILDENGDPMPQHQLPYYRAVTEKRPAQALVQAEICRTKERRWATIRSTPVFNEQGEVVQLVSSNHDVDELMRAQAALRKSEEQLRQSQKMEAMGRLAGGIAHDFNNLLTIINSYAEMAADLCHSDDAREYLKDIRNAGDRAASLTSQLLAFSRKQVLEPKVYDLNSIISAMERLLRRLISEDIELVVALGSNIAPVNVDRGQVEQVVLNLVINARDAMPKGGTLLIETRSAPTRADQPAMVQLIVRDTGVGMSPEVKERVFEPFFTTKGLGEGTGLGLSSVYGIVTQSGGTISVDSTRGIGTTFTIQLPAVLDAELRDEMSWAIEPGTLTGRTILIAEDEQVVRALVRRILVGRGYDVLEAANGVEALRIAERHTDPIHLLVTDLVMPQMSGRDLARRLWETRPGLCVLYMSGYTGGVTLEGSPDEHRTAFIQKPFKPDQLLRKVWELLTDRRSMLPPGAR